MKQQWYQFLAPVLLLAVATTQLALGGNGKITGVVKDAEGGATPGANVVIEGTKLGASSDVTGAYFILNVPPGAYSVRASAVGFTARTVTNVRVGSDQIIALDFVLQSQSVGLTEVVVEAKRPPVDKSQTGARTRLGGDDFTSLPVADVNGLVSTSASTYKGFVRGGRVFETKTIVDGIDLTDQYAAWVNDIGGSTPFMTYNAIMRISEAQNSSLVGLSKGGVEEANVLTGGVGSDYNSASAGVISYSLREGRGKWSSRVEARMSQFGGLQHAGPPVYGDDTTYFRIRDTYAASATPSDRDKAKRFTYSRDKYLYGNKPEFNLEFSSGGSVSEDLGLFVTGKWLDSHGTLPNEHTRKLNGSLKANFNIAPSMKLNGTFLLEDRGKLFGWKNRSYAEDFRYFLEGVPKWDGANITGSLKLTHILTPSTFYEIQASIVNDNSRRGFSDDNGDGQIGLDESGDYLTFADTAQVYKYSPRGNSGNTEMNKFFSPAPRNETASENTVLMSGATNWKLARPGIYYENFTDQTITLKGDITTQLDQHHQLRGGIQARLHNLDMVRRAGYIGGVFGLTYKNYAEEIWNVKPKEYSLYAQDKMEYAGLIINLGFRLDGLDISAGDFANFFAPFNAGNTPATTVVDAGGGPARVPVRGSNADTKFFFSPRIGVSHPISDRAAMYFAFSQQQQSQPFSRIYTNYNDFGNPSLPVEVRSNQDPIKSTNYDLGIQWSFYESFSLDVNVYYKDIQSYGMTQLVITPNAPWRSYNLSTEFGYADSRGLELTLNKEITPVTDFLSIGGRLTYAYSYVKQAVDAGGNVSSFSTAGGDSLKYSGQIPFDNLSFWNTIERNVIGGPTILSGSGFGGYDRPHRVTFNLVMRFPFDISLAGVGTFQSGFYFPLTLGDPRSRILGEAPWDKKVDLRIEKAFVFSSLGRLAVYVDVLNAFNWTNVISYNNSNLGQLAWERTGDPTGGPTINRPINQDGSLIYDMPRQVYFGVTLNF